MPPEDPKAKGISEKNSQILVKTDPVKNVEGALPEVPRRHTVPISQLALTLLEPPAPGNVPGHTPTVNIQKCWVRHNK